MLAKLKDRWNGLSREQKIVAIILAAAFLVFLSAVLYQGEVYPPDMGTDRG